VAEHSRGHRDARSPLVLLGTAACVLLVVSGVLRPTGASWTADAEVDAGSLAASSLDVTVAADGGPAGSSVAAETLGVSDLLPGDSRAMQLTVRNASARAPMAFTVRGRATSAALGAAVRLRVWTDASAASSGSSATGWSGSCSGGTPVTGEVSLGATDGDVVTTPVGPLAPGAERRLCVRMSLPADAPTSARGVDGRLVLTVDGRATAP
jgi:hypothetical protein